MFVSGLLSLFLMLAAPIVSAADKSGNSCQGVDLRSEFGPLKWQGDTGWCYAFSASDLMSHHLWKQGKIGSLNETNSGISAMASAIQFLRQYKPEALEMSTDLILQMEREAKKNSAKIQTAFETVAKNKFRDGLGGGAVSKVIKSYWRLGYCRESSVRSSQFPLAEYNLKRSGALVDLGLLSDIPVATRAAQVFFPTLSPSWISYILENSLPRDRLYELTKAACEWIPLEEEPKFYDSIVYTPSSFVDDAERKFQVNLAFALIDEKLREGSPVTMGIDGKLFNYNREQYYDFDSIHEVLVVGMRPACEGRGVEYIIRNSWGKEACEDDRKNFVRSDVEAILATEKLGIDRKSCLMDCQSKAACVSKCETRFKANHIRVNKPSFTCEGGYYVVPREDLEKALFDFGYLMSRQNFISRDTL